MPSIGDSLQLTRKDLLGFPEESIKYVLNLQKEKGWRGKRSNRSHVAMLSPDGMITCGLSTNPDGLRWLKRDVNRYYASKGEEETPVKEKTTTQKVTCPRPNCPKTFNSLENLDVHISVDHEGRIKCPDCKETFTKAHVLGIHRAKMHGYVSPTKTRRLELKRIREEKVQDELKELRAEKEPIVGDAVSVTSLVPDEDRVSMKEFGKSFTPEEVKEKTRALFTLDSEEKTVSVQEEKVVWEEDSLGRRVRPAKKEELEEDDGLVVGRKSWVLDMSMIMDVPVETVLKNMYAAGLGMEIRVWKEVE